MTENYTTTSTSDHQINVRTEYGYDKLGNLLTITDALTHTTVYTYDDLNRRVAERDGEGNVTTYGYDGLGRRTTVVHPGESGSVTVTTSYNLLGWPTQVEYPQIGDASGHTVAYAYDKVGNRTAVTDASGTTTYVYDHLYRPITITASNAGTVGYRHDAVGNRTRLKYPTGETVTYTHDAVNRLVQVDDWDEGVTTYGYDGASRLLTATLPNGITTTWEYDAAGRLVNLAHARREVVLSAYTYTLDGAGNRVALLTFHSPLPVPGEGAGLNGGGDDEGMPKLKDWWQELMRWWQEAGRRVDDWLQGLKVEAGSRSVHLSTLFSSPLETPCTHPQAITGTQVISYTYDGLNRLVEAAYSDGECYQYGYDEVGNRLALSETTSFTDTAVTTYTYDVANHLTSVGGVTYTWDARGNLISDGTFTYTYDAAGRMVQAESVTVTLVYTYNAQGLRVAESVDGDVTAFAWDWASGIPEMLSEDGNLYLVGHDTLGQWDGSEWVFYLPDALGSIRQETDGTGGLTDSREWTPFGVEVGTGQAGLGYTGEWWDDSAEFLYLRARWYEPQVGRFSGPDPVIPDFQNPQSINQYAYILGNP